MSIFHVCTSLADLTVNNGVASGSAIGGFGGERLAFGDGDNCQSIFAVESPIVDGQEQWVSFRTSGSGTDSDARIDIRDSITGVTDIEITGDNSFDSTIRIRYNTGGALTTILTLGGSNATSRYDLQVVRSATAGIIRMYRNGTQIGEATGLDTLNATDAVRWNQLRINYPSTSGSDSFNFASFIAADEDTRDMDIVRCTLTADGFYTDAQGTFADVDEQGSAGADEIFFDDGSERQSFVTEVNDGVNVGFEVLASVISLQCDRVGGTPSGLRGLYRVGSSDFTSAAETILEGVVDQVQFIQETNPDTGLAWTVTEIEDAEVGLETVS